MKYSLGIFNFLEEISSLSHPIVFLYFFAPITEEGFLISPCYSLELCIRMSTSFIFSFVFPFFSICKASWDNHFAFLHFFFLGMVLFTASCSVQFSRSFVPDSLWITARQASLSIANSQSSLKLTSIESVMSSSHLILCRPLLLLPPVPPSIRVFSNESALPMRCQSTGVSALAPFLPKKSQGWSPLEWTGWISLQSNGLSRVFSNTTVQKH